MRRRTLLIGGGAAVAASGAAFMFRTRLKSWAQSFMQRDAWTASPTPLPHNPKTDRAKVYVAQGGAPAANIDAVLDKVGGVQQYIGADDLVIIKVSAQWWNQGMTNVAAVRRTIERILERPDFRGEVVVFENTHFRLADGSGLSRAWTYPSERNVDVDGWNSMGDLVAYFKAKNAPVSFVGLVDGGLNKLASGGWTDPKRLYGVYGGDDRGPIPKGDARDGYHWDFDNLYSVKRGWRSTHKCALTWPRFTSPRSGLVVDLRDGVFERKSDKLVKTGRKLTWVNMTTANEHLRTGITAAVKSTMGVVDMSAGEMGTHRLAQGYHSVHYFGAGAPSAYWRMAGPLAHFAKEVRQPDLILTVAEYVGAYKAGVEEPLDRRIAASAAHHTKTVVAGVDPVAIDAWCCTKLFSELPAKHANYWKLDNPNALASKFLNHYRAVRGAGTLDLALIDVV